MKTGHNKRVMYTVYIYRLEVAVHAFRRADEQSEFNTRIGSSIRCQCIDWHNYVNIENQYGLGEIVNWNIYIH